MVKRVRDGSISLNDYGGQWVSFGKRVLVYSGYVLTICFHDGSAKPVLSDLILRYDYEDDFRVFNVSMVEIPVPGVSFPLREILLFSYNRAAAAAYRCPVEFR